MRGHPLGIFLWLRAELSPEKSTQVDNRDCRHRLGLVPLRNTNRNSFHPVSNTAIYESRKLIERVI